VIFHRAVILSGSAVSLWGYYPPQSHQTENTFSLLLGQTKCNTSSSKEAGVECLRKLTPHDLKQAEEYFLVSFKFIDEFVRQLDITTFLNYRQTDPIASYFERFSSPQRYPMPSLPTTLENSSTPILKCLSGWEPYRRKRCQLFAVCSTQSAPVKYALL
jgi:hypothetical protein